jgi:GLPGLI family protein
MRSILPLLLLVFGLKFAFAQRSIVVGDCTVTYRISGSDATTNNNLQGASKILYVKGKMARTDMIGANYRQSVIYNNNSGTAVILKEIGTEKYMSDYSAAEWKKENKNFEGQTINFTSDTKTILGYECKKAVAKLKDGTYYNIYYSEAIKLTACENPFQFKEIPGFVLEYETGNPRRTSKITYTATMINFDPVPASKFEIPTSGYRVLK